MDGHGNACFLLCLRHGLQRVGYLRESSLSYRDFRVMGQWSKMQDGQMVETDHEADVRGSPHIRALAHGLKVRIHVFTEVAHREFNSHFMPFGHEGPIIRIVKVFGAEHFNFMEPVDKPQDAIEAEEAQMQADHRLAEAIAREEAQAQADRRLAEAVARKEAQAQADRRLAEAIAREEARAQAIAAIEDRVRKEVQMLADCRLAEAIARKEADRRRLAEAVALKEMQAQIEADRRLAEEFARYDAQAEADRGLVEAIAAIEDRVRKEVQMVADRRQVA